MSRWCKDGRRRFLSFLGSFVNDSQPGGPGALEQITKKNLLPCDGPCARFILARACSAQGALEGPKPFLPFWNTQPTAGCVMSQFSIQNACIRTKTFRRSGCSQCWKLGNAISRRGNWGPHMNPTTMWLSRHAGTHTACAGRPGPSGPSGFVRASKLWHGLAWTGLGRRSRLVDPEGHDVERWDENPDTGPNPFAMPK